MSSARKTFCTVTARGNGTGACPRKYGMNWFIPAIVSSSPDSGGGITDEDGTRRCPRSSKKRRNDSRICRPCIGRPVYGQAEAASLLEAELVFLLAHGFLALRDRLGEQLGDIHE